MLQMLKVQIIGQINAHISGQYVTTVTDLDTLRKRAERNHTTIKMELKHTQPEGTKMNQ